MAFAVPIGLMLLVSPIVIGLMTRDLPERRRVVSLLVIGLGIRLLLCIIFHSSPATRLFHEDAEGYELAPLRMAAYWHGEGPPFEPGSLPNYGAYYWYGVLYYIFGPWTMLPSCVNALLGVLSALMIYKIAARYFVESVARRALVMALFFPSMILWSSTAVKDSIMMFLLVLTMNAVLRLKERFSLVHLLIGAACLFGVLMVRFYMFYVAGLGIALSFTLFGRVRAGQSVASQVVLLGVLAVGVIFLGMRQETQHELTYFDLQQVSTFRAGLASTSNSGFMEDADVSSPTKAIAFVPIGIALLLFSPFPWQMTSVRPLLALPEMLFWWGMTFAWLRGFRYVLRSRHANLLPIIIFTTLVTLAYSIVHGNAGVAFRQRSQIMLFLFLFASLGQHLKRLRTAGEPLESVESGWQAAAAAELG